MYCVVLVVLTPSSTVVTEPSVLNIQEHTALALDTRDIVPKLTIGGHTCTQAPLSLRLTEATLTHAPPLRLFTAAAATQAPADLRLNATVSYQIHKSPSPAAAPGSVDCT